MILTGRASLTTAAAGFFLKDAFAIQLLENN